MPNVTLTVKTTSPGDILGFEVKVDGTVRNDGDQFDLAAGGHLLSWILTAPATSTIEMILKKDDGTVLEDQADKVQSGFPSAAGSDKFTV